MALDHHLSQAMVDFPSGDHSKSAVAHHSSSPEHQAQPTPYLPFRRISLPSASNLHRQSVVSTASFDSTPEEPHGPSLGASPPRPPSRPRYPSSTPDAARRNLRRREIKSLVLDEQKEAKRRKVIHEFYETERTYAEGLELIYSHFLTPIIASLDTPDQLLDRLELTSIFSNFIDIWNLHRSFYSSLTMCLNTSTSTATGQDPQRLSPILLSHFPYLSLYTPFVSSFSDALSSYSALLAKHPAFAAFIAQQEADPRCGKLKFRDWLLTIVQRCPRYLLLLKDLVACTNPDDPEYVPLTTVHTLVTKITDSLNSSLHTHAQVLQLVALQRGTHHLPFQLIAPGRTFLKRGPLIQVVGSVPKEREILLFSDCLIWLSHADKSDEFDPIGLLHRDSSMHEAFLRPKTLVRTRSKSDAELPRFSTGGIGRNAALKLKVGGPSKKRHSSNGGEERWTYKGHVDLVDMEVVVVASRDQDEPKAFEILSPRKSFAIIAANATERDEWVTAIRNAKSSLLVSYNVMHPNSTLTSSTSTNHLRYALQALPYPPDDEDQKPKRGRVEHFVPAVWIPDGKTGGCMRCGRAFGWKRRRHHCRLCGRCVCASCSTKTFFIYDSSTKGTHKAARACDACYDTVFPILDPTSSPATATTTISNLTLSGLRSMPSLVLDEQSPSSLMTFDMDRSRRPLSRIDAGATPALLSEEPPEGLNSASHMPAVRIKLPSRPRSYIHILEDFDSHAHGDLSSDGSPVTPRFSGIESSPVPDEREEDDARDETANAVDAIIGVTTVESPLLAKPMIRTNSSPLARVTRIEDTVRRRKRFSHPVLAVHTTPVTARPNGVGEGKSKRWSLVLGNLKGGAQLGDFTDGLKHGVAAGKLSELLWHHNKDARSPH